ncbi:MAG: histidinol-phosphate transaminase [Deltaproteobacteria bacterium]|nr:histidinol-phosphate transaminase [Candidatus Anaeroferrophillacea bacterium]
MKPTNPQEYIRPAVRAMAGYTPGRQPAPGARVIKLNTNENPYPPSPAVAAAFRRLADDTAAFRLYPNPESRRLRETAATVFGLENPDMVIAANGSDELLRLLLDAVTDPGDTVGWCSPSYSLYPVLCGIRGVTGRGFPFDWRNPERLPDGLDQVKIFFLTSPNAPFGTGFSNRFVAALAEHFAGILVVDEAYADFADESALDLLADHPNIVVTRSFSKSYALAALRLGLGFAAPELIRELDKVRDSYNLDLAAQTAAVAALADREYLSVTVGRIQAERARFTAALTERGFDVCPSQTNFVFARPPAGIAAAALYADLETRGILVRYFTDPALADGLRITIGTPEQMDAVLAAIDEFT